VYAKCDVNRTDYNITTAVRFKPYGFNGSINDKNYTITSYTIINDDD